MLGGNSLVFFSIWEHTEGVCPWVRHTHYTLETGFIRKLAQNFGNSFWRVKHKHAPGLWLSGLQRADFIIFTRQPGLSWACTTASWVLQLVSTSREANKRNKTSHSEGGKKSIPESEWLHGALRLILESLIMRHFHARDVQPSFNEFSAPHAKQTEWASFVEQLQLLWLMSLSAKEGSHETGRKDTCCSFNRKGFGSVAVNHTVKCDVIRCVGLEACNIHKAQSAWDRDIPGFFWVVSLLHLNDKVLIGPVSCCPGELETIPASLWYW